MPASKPSKHNYQTPPTRTYTPLLTLTHTHTHTPTQLTPSSRDLSAQTTRLRSQHTELSTQFSANSASASPTLTQPNDPSLARDFRAATSKPSSAARNKSVRFTDSPRARSPPSPARAALFPYRDDPSPDADAASRAPPDQAALSNEQIHAYHGAVLRQQDAQLDALGASIGRQRELSLQIGDELEGQMLLLDEVDEGVDRHQGRLDRARGRLGVVARRARENWSLSVIVVLIVVLVLLIAVLK